MQLCTVLFNHLILAAEMCTTYRTPLDIRFVFDHDHFSAGCTHTKQCTLLKSRLNNGQKQSWTNNVVGNIPDADNILIIPLGVSFIQKPSWCGLLEIGAIFFESASLWWKRRREMDNWFLTPADHEFFIPVVSDGYIKENNNRRLHWNWNKLPVCNITSEWTIIYYFWGFMYTFL